MSWRKICSVCYYTTTAAATTILLQRLLHCNNFSLHSKVEFCKKEIFFVVVCITDCVASMPHDHTRCICFFMPLHILLTKHTRDTTFNCKKNEMKSHWLCWILFFKFSVAVAPIVLLQITIYLIGRKWNIYVCVFLFCIHVHGPMYFPSFELLKNETASALMM